MTRLQDTPSLVLFVKGMAMIGEPISFSLYEEALTKYPEYFSEEIECKRKWDAIPQSVHDEYQNLSETQLFPSEEELKEYEAILGPEPFPELPGGIIQRVMHPEHEEEYAIQDQWNKKLFALRSVKQKELRDKYYGPYGIYD